MKAPSARPAPRPGRANKTRRDRRLALLNEKPVDQGPGNQGHHGVDQDADQQRDEGEREENHSRPEPRKDPSEYLHGPLWPLAVFYPSPRRPRNRGGMDRSPLSLMR